MTDKDLIKRSAVINELAMMYVLAADDDQELELRTHLQRIMGLPAAKLPGEWIDAGKEHPEEGDLVLAVCNGVVANVHLVDEMMLAAWYDDGGGWEIEEFPEAEGITVRWWTPLPPMPEEGA